MDPITTAIIAALALGVAGGVQEVGKDVVVDAYQALKTTLRQKLGAESEVVEAVEKLEKKPDSEGRRATLAEEIEDRQVAQDPEIVAAAQALLDKAQAARTEIRQRAGEGGVIHESGISAPARSQAKIDQESTGEGSRIDDSPINLT